MRIRSTSRILIDLLHDPKDIARVAQLAARFRLPMRFGPSKDDNFLAADLEQNTLTWAFQDAAVSVCAQAVADNKSVDDVLAQIRNQVKQGLGIDPTKPIDLVDAAPAEAAR